ncbi:sn-glycerol-3-phosphate ABC transporter ATP-binding protein UgpC [Martelella lutilitoris]|uniref:sn-glycerol-3-phosphate ABC transporter ATP-binding protein UgpC n=1 Tax=Martelella lutilitoris TaxID=2583532 RepID=A0A5C4JKM1_9HYPH|nr:sn-glycerol-3-phosphate ABC transporter ATP-binding protein UgpC [Martelella lutilitoris]TNB46065.1 sn-glycerol-3-phosphate ABC transporter ATP-binding protein UgpC [Martelella lutilitoris]
MASIELEKLVKDYGAFRAIKGIDLSIEDGSFVTFVGPSGCGKSTLLRMVAGLEEISGGRLKIDGKVVNDLEPRERDIAMVFQDYALYPHMSIAENIGFGLKMRGVAKAEIEKQVKEAADILQITQLLERKPGQLSGGQRQRVAMGRAIVRRPQVYLFDEPLSNLDAKLRVDMRTQIKRLHTLLKTTTIYVTHDQVEAMTLADHIVILKDGVIMQQGKPVSVYERPVSRFVGEFIGSPKMNIIESRLASEGGAAELRFYEFSLPVAGGDENGKAVEIGIRPEHLIPCAPEEALFSARIDVLEPLGSDTHAICLLGDTEITARLAPDPSYHPGQILHFTADADKIHFFDTKTGARLEMAAMPLAAGTTA